MNVLFVFIGLLVLFVLLEMKTSRPDGTMLSVHPYRRLMAFVMPTRSESIVFFDSHVDAEKLLTFVDEHSDHPFPVGLTHCVVAAANIGLAENPSMNRFVIGGRMYQRKGRWLTFSMKRKKLDKAAKLAVVKLQMLDGESFYGFCERVNDQINTNRSGKKTYADKEFALFNALPRVFLRMAVPFLRFLDDRNLLPGFFIDGDGMYTSVFAANLGSLGMAPGYHHLYEWGTCPLFMMIGKVEERAVVENGEVVVKKILPIRYSYDERIDDGLTARHGMDTAQRVLEDPVKYLNTESMLAHLPE